MPSKIIEQTNYPAHSLKTILNVVIALLIFLILLVESYFLYQNIPGKPENLDITNEIPKLEVENISGVVKQFYPNMKFNHNSISYRIGSECDNENKERMIEAFNELKERVTIISFYPVLENPDIEITCSDYINKKDKDYFIAGEGGAKEIIQTGKYNVITEGIIILHGNPHKFYKCPWPNIELHELLHVFGFDHSENKNSLMYPYLESCDQKLDESIISYLQKLYSQENLADLYFESVKSVKRGRYIDLNITVKNSGVLSAKNVILSVFEEDVKLNDFDLEEIVFGGGVNLNVANLRLGSRGSENIKIKIDPDNLIKEIDKENNIAELNFN